MYTLNISNFSPELLFLVFEVNIQSLSNKDVDEWLESLNLKELYLETFKNNLFTSMEKVSKIWDDELTSILDIEKIGHRKRILLSVAGKHDIANRFGKVGNTHNLAVISWDDYLIELICIVESALCHCLL